MRTTTILIVTFLPSFFWMNLSSRVIHVTKLVQNECKMRSTSCKQDCMILENSRPRPRVLLSSLLTLVSIHMFGEKLSNEIAVKMI